MPLKPRDIRLKLDKIPNIYAARTIRFGIFRISRTRAHESWKIYTVNGRFIGAEGLLANAVLLCLQQDETLRVPQDIELR